MARMKIIGKFFKRFPPVAKAVLLHAGHFGKCYFMAFGDEYRIVPESSFPLWFPCYTTFGVAEKSLYHTIRESQSHTADEPGTPHFIINVSEFEKQFLVIPDITIAVYYAGKPRRVNAGCAIQSIDFEA